ncbi:hypothetical protein D3C84_520710 [compost metagenome]
MTQSSEGIGGGIGPGSCGALYGSIEPPLAAGDGIVFMGMIVSERLAVERHPVLWQQLPVSPAPLAGHQQTDPGQIPCRQVGIGRRDERAGGIGFPNGVANAQRFEHCSPWIVGIAVGADNGFQRGGQQVAVTAGVTKGLTRRGVRSMRRSEPGHVVAPAGVEHGHHRRFQRCVFVVLLPVQARGPVQQVGHGHVGVYLQGRIKLRHRVVELEQAFAVGHTEDGGHQALADRPGQVRRLGRRRAGVAFVDQLAVADHQQGIGADALASAVIAGRKGVGLQSLKRRAGRRRGGRPLLGGPVFSLGREAEQQQENQGQAFGHGGGSEIEPAEPSRG